jgi:O-antigen/teichoic acid export membrane protein
LYAAVCRIPNAVITAQGLIVLGLVPGVSRYLATRDPIVIQRLRRKCLAVGGEAAAVVVVGIPVAIWMLPRIFGSAFASGRFALVVLLLAAAVSVATTALFPIALGLGRDRAMCAGYVGVAVVNVVANLVVIPRWSYNGAAVVMLGSQFALAATYLYTARIKEPA